jgi:hypothetical protein
MAVLHKEAEKHVNTQHKAKHVEQKNSSQMHEPKQQSKHVNGLASFEKDMGVNTTHAKNGTETSNKVASPEKKEHKGKHHKGKKEHTPKPSINTTGKDAMTILHDETSSEDSQGAVTKQVVASTTTTTTTTTTTNTFSKASKGLLHLREDMYMGGHQDKVAPKSLSNPHHKMPGAGGTASAGVVHSAISVAKKHRQSKYDQFRFSKSNMVVPTDPMAAVHQEAQIIHSEEGVSSKTPSGTPIKPQKKPVAEAVSAAPLIAAQSVEHAGGLARLDHDLDNNTTKKQAKAKNTTQKVEGSVSQPKHVSHSVKQHHKKGKPSSPQVVKAADKADPMSSLHHELHPKEDDDKPAVKIAPKVAKVPQEPKLKVHESRQNSLRKLRDDTSR